MPLPRPQRRRALAIALIEDGREHRQVAEAAGISPVTFSGICTGRVRSPKPETLSRIAAVLGRHEYELFPELVKASS